MPKITATIITGFLGAGKTTLLNRLIAETNGHGMAIIVNEYGEIGIDGGLIVGAQDEVIELNNGCLCCAVRGDLIDAVARLLSLRRHIDRIVIETSGLADPAPVIQSFIVDPTLAEHVSLDAVVTVVDARHIARQLGREDEAAEQIAFADVILLNKVDLEPLAAVDLLAQELRRRNPLARIIRTQACNVAPDAVLDIGAFDIDAALRIDPALLQCHQHDHDNSIGCVALQSPEPVNAIAFNAWIGALVQEIGRDLLRFKGIVSIAGERRRLVFHGVHMTLDGRPGQAWKNGENRSSTIVFIGRNLSEEVLLAGFESCFERKQESAA